MPTLQEWWIRLKRDFRLAMLPHKPGAYRLLDRSGAVIHTGAADDLSIRVAAHFGPSEPNEAIKQNVADFQSEIAASEEDARALSQRWAAGGMPAGGVAPPAPPPGTA